MTLSLPPLSLYVHLPWCVRKCPYCDFNSHTRDGALPEQDYLRALLHDLDGELADAAGRPLQSVFFGGGTPSLLSAGFYHAFMDALAAKATLADDLEVTLEANPGTVEQDRFDGYRRAGINRLSIGVQSFNDQHLRALGRIHGGNEARRAIDAARRAGFDRINTDLMHALPEQSAEQAVQDLRTALECGASHLSWYELTVEPNTLFWRAPPPQPEDDQRADIEDAGFALLAEAGFQRYEVSAFAPAGEACRHNLNYWQFGDYLAIGAGAHGKLSQPASNRILRYRKTRLPAHYLADDGQCRRDVAQISAAERPFEFMLNALRLCEGVPAALFPARTGLPLAVLDGVMAPLVQRGLMHPVSSQRLACTPLGLRFLNQVLDAFQDIGL